MMDSLLGKCRTALLDLLFPPKCAFCGKLLETSGDVCEDCEKGLPYREEGQILSAIGEEGFPCAIALYYEDMIREGVLAGQGLRPIHCSDRRRTTGRGV